MGVTTISPQELYDVSRAGGNVELIDVRTPVEFRDDHVSFARNVPLHQLDATILAVDRSGTSQPLYVICQSGARGKQACEKLLAAGDANVVNVEGGIQNWVLAGLPVVRGQKTISLERQVRIAAGLLVLIGALLSYFAHPYWMALPAIVGAGLVFAGITDTCGMGMLLAKMFWNQARNADPAKSANCSVGRCR
jgi:rhodanese-related sulfurtransferase